MVAKSGKALANVNGEVNTRETIMELPFVASTRAHGALGTTRMFAVVVPTNERTRPPALMRDKPFLQHDRLALAIARLPAVLSNC